MRILRNRCSVKLTCPKASVNSTFCLRQVVLLVAVAFVVWIGTALPVGGQDLCQLKYMFISDAEGDRFGYSVSGAGDVNNDNWDDVIVGAELNEVGGNNAGQAYVFSGMNGMVLWTFTGEAAGDHFGRSVSGAGDVNNDGFDDVIVGARHNDMGGEDAGRAYVYSGQTGVLLWAFTGEAANDQFGQSVSGVGDVNNDGFDDVIVGARYNDAGGPSAGRAYVYSGANGALLWVFTGDAMGDQFGFSVSGAGDVNNDGFDDVIVGARYASGNFGLAYVYSGQNGALLWIFVGQAADDQFGFSVSGAGDVNLDGFGDLIVGAIYNDAGGDNAGRAYVYSGQTGALLWTFTGEAAGDLFGYSVSGAGDVNWDNRDDLIVGAHFNDAGGDNAGRAYVYSGQTGALLWTFTGEAEGDQLGLSVSGAGDVDRDGLGDLILGAPYSDVGGFSAGRAYVYSGWTGDLLYSFVSDAEGDNFGNSVSGAGDVNNDNYADLIVGAPEIRWVNPVDPGRAYVHSGQDGDLLWIFSGEAVGDWFGYSVSGVGDVNNDGFDDVIVGARYNDTGGGNAGRAYVYSGQTGVQLWTFTGAAAGDQFGFSVSGAGDVNNDNYADLIVGAPYNDAGGGNAGQAYVYSGQNGTLLHTFTGEAPGDNFGWSVSGAGDVNFDGFADLIVGAVNAAAGIGRAYVYSGINGALLHTFTGVAPGDNFGWSVSGAGYVNHDGFADLIMGSPFNDVAGIDAGAAYVYSGQNWQLLYTFFGGTEDDFFGYSVSGAGDVNDDARGDLIVGAPESDMVPPVGPGRAYVYSGWTGNLLCMFEGETDMDQFGFSVSGAGNVDNEFYDDLIVGAPYNEVGGPYAGRAYVYTCGPNLLLCGDCTGDGVVDLGDVIYLINYLYRGGPPPDPLCIGDVNCDGEVDLGDVIYLINYLYHGGPPPCGECCDLKAGMEKPTNHKIERHSLQIKSVPQKLPQASGDLKQIE